MPTFKTYTLRIIGPEEVLENPGIETSLVEKILAGRVLEDAEDVIDDILPDGWRAKIEEWDTPLPMIERLDDDA